MMEHDHDPVPSGTLLIDAAAQVLGVSRRTVYYRIRQGRLRTIRTRNGSQRVLRSSIEALLRVTPHAPPPPAAVVRGEGLPDRWCGERRLARGV